MNFRKAYLEITNVCNLRCSFCPGHEREATFLTPERFRILAKKIRPYTEYLYLHVMGEPLLHPQLGEILRVCAELSFNVILTTNGTLLREKQPLLLDSPALYKVNVSLHSFEANDGQNLEDYLADCCGFADAASKKGILCVFRLWNENSETLPGKNSANGRIFGYLQDQLAGEWESNSKGMRIRHRLHLEWDEIFSWPDLSAPACPDHYCFALRDQFAVLSDGTVVPCCLDRNGVIALGNLFTDSLEEILHSENARNLSASLSCGIPNEELCKRCGYAAAKFPK